MANRTWTAQVYCGSEIGTVTANVEAGTISGAEAQIHAKYANVQQIGNLREVNTGANGGGGADAGGAMALGYLGLLVIGAIAALHAAPFIGAGLLGFGATKGTKGQGGNWKRLATIAVAGTVGFYGGQAVKDATVVAWAEDAANETEQVAPAPAPAAEAPVFVPAPAAAPAPVKRTAAPAVRPVFEAAPVAAPAAEAMPWETDEDLTGNAAFVFQG